MTEFKQFLEDADFEVSIELYPYTSVGQEHYQIYKPESSVKHCWELYLNPNKPNEREIGVSYDTLDDAISAMVAFSEKNAERFRFHRDMFNTAMDVICGECCYESGDDCEKCMVRKTADLFNGAKGE